MGKTAIAEGLARRIIEGRVPEILADAQVYALDMGALFRGHQIPWRLRSNASRPCSSSWSRTTPTRSLFIDEIHTSSAPARRRAERWTPPTPQAGAVKRTAEVHRRDDLQPSSGRSSKGPRPLEALPEDRCHRTIGRRDRQIGAQRVASRSITASSILPRRPVPRRTVRKIHQRPPPAGQGDRRDRRGRRGQRICPSRSRRKRSERARSREIVAKIARIPPRSVRPTTRTHCATSTAI